MKKLLFLLLCGAAFGQGVRFDLPPVLNSRGVPIANPNISLCTGAATINGATCSIQATSFTDITLATPCAGGSPVTLANSNVCRATGDALGNAGFWLTPGAYIYCVTAPSTTGQCYNLTVPVGAASTGAIPSLNGVCYVAAGVTLASAITCAGTSGTIEVTPLAGTISGTGSTIPAGVTLRVDQGALISGTPAINGAFQAGNYQVFTGAPTFADGQGMVNASWFPGVDMGAQINNAYAALPGGNHGGSIFVPQGAYNYNTPILLNSTSKPVALKGAGTNNTFLVYTASSGIALTLDTGIGTGNSILEDFTLLTFVSAATTTGLSVGPTNLCNFCKFDRLVIQNFQTLVTNNAFGAQFSSVNLGPCSSAASSVAFVQAGSGDDSQLINNTITGCATLVNNNNSAGPIWMANVQITNATTVFINANGQNVNCISCHLFNQAAGSPTNWFTASSSLYFANSFFEDAKSSGTQASCGSVTSGTLNLSNVTITNEGGETCTVFVALSSTAALSGNGITNTNTALVPALYTAAWPKATVFGYHTSALDNAVTVLFPLILNAAPTIAANGCGGSAASMNANPNGPASFAFNVGTAPGSACTVTLPSATNGWSCSATDTTTQSTSVFLQKAVPASLTSLTITNFNTAGAATAFVASDFVEVNCFAR